MSYIYSLLLTYSKPGHINELRRVLDEYAAVLSYEEQFYIYALQSCAQAVNMEGFVLILKYFTPHTYDWNYYITRIARRGHLPFLKLLFERGATKHIVVLQVAIVEGHQDIIDYVLHYVNFAGNELQWSAMMRRLCATNRYDIFDAIADRVSITWPRLIISCNTDEMLLRVLERCPDRIQALDSCMYALNYNVNMAQLMMLIKHGATQMQHIQPYHVFELLDKGLPPAWFQNRADLTNATSHEFRRLYHVRRFRHEAICACTPIHVVVVDIILDYVGWS
jgi:hypothetical protein